MYCGVIWMYNLEGKLFLYILWGLFAAVSAWSLLNQISFVKPVTYKVIEDAALHLQSLLPKAILIMHLQNFKNYFCQSLWPAKICVF